jgi:type IV pilus assembly protein PilP
MGRLTLIFSAGSLCLLAACGDDEPIKPNKPPAAQPQKPGGAAPGGRATVGPGAGGPPPPPSNLPPLPIREFIEPDFAESDSNRDPFKSYASLFVMKAKSKDAPQKTVLMEKYALEQIKLSGLVGRGQPSALLVDPSGVGWVAKVGDFVGKADVVHASGTGPGNDVAIYWRVDRIRDEDVVFVREDPAHPEIQPSTRVVPLHPGEKNVFVPIQR